jgi:hypothetical protein
MRLSPALLSTGFALFTIAACAQVVPSSDKKMEQAFTYSFAMRGCTQEDAPALEIYLTKSPFTGTGNPSTPYIRFEISSSANEAIAPVSLELIQLRRDPTRRGRIVRAEFVERGHDPVWLSGTIGLSEAAPGRHVSGHYDVTTSRGRRWSGRFIADYSNRSTVCG